MPKQKSEITIDVRPLLAAGEEPFGKIKAAVDTLADSQTLIIVSPFLPSPLIERIQASGFTPSVFRRDDGSWETHFKRA
jgi:uncharacterized protein (DUF2249 family)